MSMSVSAIVPAYNAERFLVRAVESLIQTAYPNLEIIIIDDGSTDTTFSIARELQIKYPAIVQVLRHSDYGNHGVSASRNLGILNSSGELICFLDADDYVYSRRFETSVPMLEKDQSIDGVYELTEMEYETKDDQLSWGFKSKLFGLKEKVESEQLLSKLLNGSVWATSAILVRREFLNSTGYFPDAQQIAEDCSLWFRMAATGRIVAGNLSKPVSVYYRHDGNTYHPGVNHKPAMMVTIIDAYHWALKTHKSSRRVLNSFRMRLTHMLLEALMEGRSKRGIKTELQLLQLVIANRCYSILFQLIILRNIIAWFLGKILFAFHKSV